LSAARLQNFNVGVTNINPNVTAPTPSSYSLCKFNGPTYPWISTSYAADLTCDVGTLPGRFLVIQFASVSNYLTLCEVQVFGTYVWP
jgi:hypothetical protein